VETAEPVVGTHLAKRAEAAMVGERIPAAERLALVHMGLHALDSAGRNKADPPGVYWGGHARLSLAVYGVFTPATKRNITRIIRNLEYRKLIRVYDVNVGGRVAYELLPQNPEGGG